MTIHILRYLRKILTTLLYNELFAFKLCLIKITNGIFCIFRTLIINESEAALHDDISDLDLAISREEFFKSFPAR